MFLSNDTSDHLSVTGLLNVTDPNTSLLHCVQKVARHLQKLLEVMSTSVYTGLNPFNFIRIHFP
jgi:hypothetical protein